MGKTHGKELMRYAQCAAIYMNTYICREQKIVGLYYLGSGGDGFEGDFGDVVERRRHEELDGEVCEIHYSSTQSTSHFLFVFVSVFLLLFV